MLSMENAFPRSTKENTTVIKKLRDVHRKRTKFTLLVRLSAALATASVGAGVVSVDPGGALMNDGGPLIE